MPISLERVFNGHVALVNELPEDMSLHRVRIGIHEAGHALVADALGFDVRYARIDTGLFGGVVGGTTSGHTPDWIRRERGEDCEEGVDNVWDMHVKFSLAGNEAGAWAWHHYLGYDLAYARDCELPGSGWDLSLVKKDMKGASKPLKQLQRETEQFVKANRQGLFRLGLDVAIKRQLAGKKFAGQAKTAA